MVLAELPVKASDRELVLRAREGDQQAFAVLMEAHRSEIHRLVLKFVWDNDDANDIAQDAWIRAAGHLDQLDDDGRFLPWVKSIARNASRTFLARGKQQRDRTVTFDDFGSSEFEDEDAPTPEHVALSRDRQRQVWEVLGTLSERDRRALFLREYESRPYTEISNELGISRSAAEQCVFRARERFRQVFDHVEADEVACGMDPLRLSALLDGDVPSVTVQPVREHVGSCDRCEQRLRTMRAGRALYRHLGVFAMPLGPLPGLGGLGQLIAQLLGLLGLGGSTGTAGGAAAVTATTATTTATAATGAGIAVAGGAGVAAGTGASGAAISGIAATIMVVAATAGIAGGAISTPARAVDPTPVTGQVSAQVASAAPLLAPATDERPATTTTAITPPVEAPVVALVTPAVHVPEQVPTSATASPGADDAPGGGTTGASPTVESPPPAPGPSPAAPTTQVAAPTPTPGTPSAPRKSGTGEQAATKETKPTDGTPKVAPTEVVQAASFIGGQVAGMIAPSGATSPSVPAPTTAPVTDVSPTAPPATTESAPVATAAEIQASVESVLNGVVANADPSASREEILTAMEDAVREYFTNGEGAGMIPPDQMPE